MRHPCFITLFCCDTFVSHNISPTESGDEVKSTFIKCLIAIVAVCLILWLLDEVEAEPNEQVTETTVHQVSVLLVEPKGEPSQLVTTGMVKARWPLEVMANVRGRLMPNHEWLPGDKVKKDQVLAQVEDMEYASMLATARSQVAQAELNLAQVLNQQSVARQLEKGKSENDYRLYKPHVAAAKAELLAAKANVKARLKQWNDTRMLAPFDAVVLAKHVAPLQQINEGERLFTLAAADAVDVEVHLSDSQWQQIFPVLGAKQQQVTDDQKQEPINAQVTDAFGTQWLAQLRYLSPLLNAQTRQRSVVLTVPFIDREEAEAGDSTSHVQASLLPQQQVKVSFSAQFHENAITAPATALTRDNKVWTLTQGQLQLEPVELIAEDAEQVKFIFADQPAESRLLVVFPLSTMLVGQAAEPKLLTAQEAF